MRTSLIGISGKAGSGKDWLAAHLAFYGGYLPMAFAWPLKLALMQSHGFTYDDVFVTKPPVVRLALQDDGQSARCDDPEHWIHQFSLLMQVLTRDSGVRGVVVKDVRYENEAEYVLANSGLLIRMEHGDRPYPLAGTPAALHESETALDDFPFFTVRVTNNVGTDFGRDVAPLLMRAGVRLSPPSLPPETFKSPLTNLSTPHNLKSSGMTPGLSTER